MTIYVESVLVINFGANLALLWMSGRGLALRLSYWRLVLGAGLGAAYALVCLASPSTLVAGLPAKLICAGMMLAISYAPQTTRGWVRLSCVFALSSMAAAGFTLAATMGTGYPVAAGNVLVIGRHAATFLPLGMGLALLVATAAGRALTVAATTKSQCCAVTIYVGGASTTVRMLVDTGNKLLEPLSGLPVAVVEYAAVDTLVPASWRDVIEGGLAAAAQITMPQAAQDTWTHRLRLVPYRSLGIDGTLVAFRPDRLRLTADQHTGHVYVTDVVVAVSPRRLSLQGEFTGILPAGLVSK